MNNEMLVQSIIDHIVHTFKIYDEDLIRHIEEIITPDCHVILDTTINSIFIDSDIYLSEISNSVIIGSEVTFSIVENSLIIDSTCSMSHVSNCIAELCDIQMSRIDSAHLQNQNYQFTNSGLLNPYNQEEQ